jgi:hypothetical protein
MPLEPGIYENVPAEEYHSDPCDRPSLSASIAKILVSQSPAHAYVAHPKLGGEPWEPDENMDMGSLGHAILLRQNRPVSLIPFKDYKTNEAKRLRKSAREQGALPILEHKLPEAKEAAERIRDRLKLKYGIELTGKSEVTVIWDEEADDGTLVRCRAQMDHLLLPRILDLKMTGDASEDAVTSRVSQLDYQIQGAAYTSGIEHAVPELVGRVEFELINCEPFKPYAVRRADMAGSMRELGQRKWRRAVNTWARCLRTNHWEDYPVETLHVEAKPWQLNKEIERTYVDGI